MRFNNLILSLTNIEKLNDSWYYIKVIIKLQFVE